MKFKSGDALAELIRQRVDTFSEYRRQFCLSDGAMRRRLRKAKPDIRFARSRFRVRQIVYSHLHTGTYLIVGHGFTGNHGEMRGAFGCRVGRTTIYKKWQWLGPDEMLRPA